MTPELTDTYVETIDADGTSPSFRRCTIREHDNGEYRIEVDLPPTDDGARWWFETSLGDPVEATVTFSDGTRFRATIAIEETDPASGEFGGRVEFLETLT